MRKIQLSGNSAAASTTGLLSNATGATWTLTATSAGDDLAHKITIKGDTATNHSAKTAVITGTDANDNPLTETVNLPNGTATVTTTGYFKTVSTVVPSATIGTDTMDIGWAADSISPYFYPKTNRIPQFNIGFGCTVVSGSPTYTVQHSYDDSAWFNHSSVAAKTASADGTYTSPFAAMRLSWTAAGEVSLTGFQVDA